MYYKVKIPAIRFESMKKGYTSTARKVSKATKKTASKVATASVAKGKSDVIEDVSATSIDKGTLKSMIKDKLNKKVTQKQEEEQVKQMFLNFPKDKPTYDVTILETEETQDVTVDEDRLLGKAESIKSKLAEFGINVDVE